MDGGRRGNGAKRNDLADRNPGAAGQAAERIPCVMCRLFCFIVVKLLALPAKWWKEIGLIYQGEKGSRF